MTNLFMMSEFGEKYGIAMHYLHDRTISYLSKHYCNRVQKYLWAGKKFNYEVTTTHLIGVEYNSIQRASQCSRFLVKRI
jgi:hypothetical protein